MSNVKGSAALGGVCLAAIAMLCPLPAIAQTTQPAVSVKNAEAETSGDIVVTAQKRTERLIDAPQSVTALTADALAKLGATQLRDYATTIPGLAISSSGVGQTQITLRGITTGRDISALTGIYVDDVPYGFSSASAVGSQLALDAGLFDLDRIEVLRGPQGTLYGASAMGGLLKYVTRAPDLDSFGGSAQAGASSTHEGGVNYNGSAALNAPIVTDKIAVRIGGFYSHDAGYIDNLATGRQDVDRSHVYGVRGDLLLAPTDALRIRISAFGQNISRDGMIQADYNFDRTPRDGTLDQRRLNPEPFDQRYRLVSGTASYDLGGADLTSVTSYQSINSQFAGDYSPLYVPLLGSLGLRFASVAGQFTYTTKKFAQEVRIASSGTRTIDWIAGGFYTHEQSESFQHLSALNVDGSAYTGNLYTLNLSNTFAEVAGFGDLTAHFTSKFDITGGVRFARNNQRYDQVGSGLLIKSAPSGRSAEGVFTYLANARYRFSRDATVYARFATGYRPGGPNVVASDPITGAPLASPAYTADKLNSYELGFKAQTAGGTFGIDAAAYYIDWNNIQVATTRNGLSVVANASGATSRGGELTLTARPTAGLLFTGAFGYTDAKLSDAAPTLGAVKGERLPNVPRFSAAINSDYTIPASGDLKPTVGGTLRFVSDRTASYSGSSSLQYRLPSYETVDLRAGVQVGIVALQVFAHNIFDVRGQLSASTSLSSRGGPARVAILQPRTIGVSASARF